MKKLGWKPGVALATLVAVAGCSGAPQTPLSPTAAIDGSQAAAADGSTLKYTAPVLTSPENGTRIDTRRPLLIWQNSIGKYAGVGVAYEVEVVKVSTETVVYTVIVGEGPGLSEHAVPADGEYDTEYRWRVRARLDTGIGPWSTPSTFRTVQQVTIGTGGGSVGPPRNIFIDEAVSIIQALYAAGSYDLGSGSTRDQRNAYIEIAVATIHYGHPVWNPRGPDSNWCIKNGGPGRPQADDVIVLCDTRDAWDLVISIGANSWQWHTDYIGRLDSAQAVYAPNRNALNLAPAPRGR
jgi:hypothetical protein